MPLTATDRPGIVDGVRKAIGFWMKSQDGTLVRVFITPFALRELDPSKVPDHFGDLETFSERRAEIEAMASRKFDAAGTDEGEQHEGQPVLTLNSNDVP